MEAIEAIKELIKPELLIVTVVLYFVSMGLKKSNVITDKYIPIILGVLGILIAGIYVFATSYLNGGKAILMGIFTSITQGVVIAGVSVSVNQILKQIGLGKIETKASGIANPLPCTVREYKIGSKVRISPSADTYCTGEKIPCFVKENVYTVVQIGSEEYPNGVLLKEIMSWVNDSDITLV